MRSPSCASVVERRSRVPTRSQPGGCRALRRRARPPRELVGAFQTRGGGLLGEPGVVLGVTAAPSVRVVGLVEAFPCVCPQRLEHRVPRAAVGGTFADHHRLRDQARECLDDIPPLRHRHRSRPLRRRRHRRTREDAEPSEHALFGAANTARTTSRPWHGGSGAARPRPPATGQESEALVETGRRSQPGSWRRSAPAASSIASGTPSSRRHSSPTASPVDASSTKVESTAWARSTNRRAASLRTNDARRPRKDREVASERSALMCSPRPRDPRGSSPGCTTWRGLRSTAFAIRAAASSRCSQLSSRSEKPLGAQELDDATLDREAAGRACTPSASGDDLEHRFWSVAAASSQSHAPSGSAAGPRPRPGSRGASCRHHRHRSA